MTLKKKYDTLVAKKYLPKIRKVAITEKRWKIFKDTFLREHGVSILQHRKSSRGGRKSTWLSKYCKVKRKTCRQRKQGWVAWEE